MQSKRKGFTLVEIMIVVVIIGLLAALAIPAFQKVRLEAKFSRFMNDVRVFSGAVETLYLETGLKPIDSNTGQMQAELREYVRMGFFTSPTPIGGRWDVEADDSGIGLGVGVVNYSISSSELQKLDSKYDNGDLKSGRLMEIVNGRYYWVMEL